MAYPASGHRIVEGTTKIDSPGPTKTLNCNEMEIKFEKKVVEAETAARLEDQAHTSEKQTAKGHEYNMGSGQLVPAEIAACGATNGAKLPSKNLCEVINDDTVHVFLVLGKRFKAAE